jgi:hypothetical protein
LRWISCQGGLRRLGRALGEKAADESLVQHQAFQQHAGEAPHLERGCRGRVRRVLLRQESRPEGEKVTHHFRVAGQRR